MCWFAQKDWAKCASLNFCWTSVWYGLKSYITAETWWTIQVEEHISLEPGRVLRGGRRNEASIGKAPPLSMLFPGKSSLYQLHVWAPSRAFHLVLRPLPACVGAGETLAYLQCITPNLTPQQFVPTHKTFLIPIPHVERNFMDSIAAELFSTWEVQNLPIKLLMKQKTDQKFRSCYFCFERKNSF